MYACGRGKVGGTNRYVCAFITCLRGVEADRRFLAVRPVSLLSAVPCFLVLDSSYLCHLKPDANAPATPTDMLKHATEVEQAYHAHGQRESTTEKLGIRFFRHCTGHLVKDRDFFCSFLRVSHVGRIFQDYVVDPLAEGMWDSMHLLRGPFRKADVLKVHTQAYGRVDVRGLGFSRAVSKERQNDALVPSHI